MKINKKIVAALSAVIMAAMSLSAQNSGSPYSRFGYGLLNDNATSAQRQMGGVGYAMTGGRQVNVMNPASYARIDSLTFIFDLGVDLSIRKSREGSVRDKRTGGGLDYMTMMFPVSKYIGMSAGLVPVSTVSYSFGNQITNGRNSHEGSGGINQLYLGLGARLFKGFTIGTNVSYLFGSTLNDIYAYTSSGSTSLFEQSIEVRDWGLQFGAQYAYELDTRNKLSVGVSFTPGKTLLGHAQVIKYDVTANETPDTLSRMPLRDNFSMPSTFGAGVNYELDNRMMLEADVTYQPWSKAKFANMDDFSATKFNDRIKFALGFQYKHRQRGNFFQLISYRLGGFYNRDYMKVGDNSVREYGITCGLGLPTHSSKTVINLGFEYRHRQAHPDPLLKENYFNITFGVNFSQLWFEKRKIR